MNNHARNYKVPKPIMPEKQFLDKHPRPLVTVDIVIISESKDYLDVLLIQRKNHPFSNFWALPGGFILKDESPYQAADRKLKSETNEVVKRDLVKKIFDLKIKGVWNGKS